MSIRSVIILYLLLKYKYYFLFTEKVIILKFEN